VAVGVALALAAAVATVLVVLALLRPEPPASSARAQPTTTTPSRTVVSGTSSTHPVAPAGFVVQSQGRATLADPSQGLDLTSGRQVVFARAQLAWLGPLQLLSVFEETTLGATVLGEVPFGGVTAARLASADYRRGIPNLSPADLPVGAVLAVRVAARTYAKVAVLRYGPDDALELRWVTYRAG
jgi:hypothetical protein